MKLKVYPLRESWLAEAAAIEATASEGWSEQALREEMESESGRVFVLLADKQLCGVAVFQLAADEASLLSVTVLPERRGCGLGRVLLERALAGLRGEGAACCFLEVRRSNKVALRLYATLGFAPVGLRRGFYHAPDEDAVLMKLDYTKQE